MVITFASLDLFNKSVSNNPVTFGDSERTLQKIKNLYSSGNPVEYIDKTQFRNNADSCKPPAADQAMAYRLHDNLPMSSTSC